MGAGAGAAAAIENEPSPRRAAIEKAQAELRREVAVREERRRELEFLEKGGEPLDFFTAEPTAPPPLSPTDPLADQLLSSEVEGRYASIPLANGDSLENSVGTSFFVGRGSEGGDHRIGDDGASTASESLPLPWEGKFRAPRTASTSLRSQADLNLKRESESSSGGRTALKNQAYSRRNRQRSNRFNNGFREVDRAVESSSTPSSEHKGSPAASLVSVEASKGNESMVEKNVEPVLVQLALPTTSGNKASQGNATSTDYKEGSALTLVEQPDQNFSNHVSNANAGVDSGKPPLSGDASVEDCVILSWNSDVKDSLCTDFNVKEDLLVGANLKELDPLSLGPCLEENVGVSEGSAVSQPLKQVSCNKSAAVNKEGALSVTVKDESVATMVRDRSSISSQLGPHATKSECKNKSPIRVADSQAPRVLDRDTTMPSNHVRDSNPVVNFDDKRFVQLEVPAPLQVPSMSLDSSENRSNNTRKTTSTASTDALNLTKSNRVMTNEKAPESVRVQVKIEEVSEAGTRLSGLETEAESGHDLRRVCVITLPQEEVKVEGQSTPVSTGSNRTGFRTPSSLTTSNKFPGVVLPWEKERDPNVIAEAERHKANLSAKARKAHEEYVLEEALLIQARKSDAAGWEKRKPEPEPMRRKSHWDFVLEEMAWMANDFMQERLWKMASATQFSRWIAQLKGQTDFQATDLQQRQWKVAHILANSVNDFWRTIELLMVKEKDQAFAAVNSQREVTPANVKDDGEAIPMDVDQPPVGEASTKHLAKHKLSKRSLLVQGYAKRFLTESRGSDFAAQAEAPSTPARTSESSSTLDPLWEEKFFEEPLCYTVPNGAFEAYRHSVEAQRALLEAEYEQTLQEHAAALAEAEAQAAAEAVATSEFIASCVDEGQSLTGHSSPVKGIRGDDDGAQYGGLPHSSIAKKKRKTILKSTPKLEGLPSSGLSRPLPFGEGFGGGSLPTPVVTAKRSLPTGSTPTSGIVGSIPTKRMRSGTARQRPLGTASPSSFPGPAGIISRTTFSSGALNSNHAEVNNMTDSTISTRTEGDAAATASKNVIGGGSNNSFISSKSKKKKKTKHFSGALGSNFKVDGAASGNTGSSLKPVESEHHSMYDQLKRKGDQLHTGSFEAAAGGIGSSAETPETPASQGLQPAKKPKLSKQASDINSDTATAAAVPAAQTGSVGANTSSTSKLLRQNSNRDRNRKSRSNKVSVSQPAGIGIPWSTIEDQAILALVHDLGPNWELVSDVLSSSSQLKGIFRRPKQCKERHKALMDRLSVGEGGDSPEDPSTSQPHPSTLPGIPKGSARVLLQRLQGPLEEDTLKVHLETIVRVGNKFKALKTQPEEQKLVPPHQSHLNVASQCNNGLTLNPLEMIKLIREVEKKREEELAGLAGQTYQLPGTHLPSPLPSGSGIRPATNGMPVMPGAGSLHMGGVPAMAPSNAAVNAARDVHRLAAMRPFSPEDAQRVRYAHAMAARRLPIPGASVTAGLPMMALPNPNDCALPMLAAGNSVGMMGGLSRGMSLSRAGLPGMGSPGVSGMGSPTLGTMLPPGGVGMVGGTGSSGGQAGVPSQVNSMRRPRDQMVRPGRTSEEQRLFVQELQHQAAQGNAEAQTHLNTLNRDPSNPLIPAPSQNFPTPQHPTQQQLMAARIFKERQLQQQQQHKQRLLQQHLQQQQQQQQQQPNSHPLPLQQQQLHAAMSQQHGLPQQTHMQHHQHLLPQQQLALQKQQTQQGPQQPGLPHPSSPMQPMASPTVPSNQQQQQHQTLSQSQSQSQSQQQPQSSGQVPQLSVQSKVQQPKQSQKHQPLQQSAQALLQQQQQLQQQQAHPRGSKGVARGSMMMQALPSQPGQSSMLPGNVSHGNQLAQQLPGQAISHSLSGQRPLQPQVPMSMGKQLSQGTPQSMTGQAGPLQAQQNPAVAVSATPGLVGQQQKVLQQPSQMPLAPKQQQASPSMHPSHSQQSASTPGLPAQQQQLSPSSQQSQIAPSQQHQQPQTRRQPQQQTPLQQSGQRRLQQRQPGSNAGGVQVPSQLVKNGTSLQSQIAPQIAAQSGHVAYPLGTSMAGSMSMMGTPPTASGITPLGNSSPAGVHSTQWKPGQNVAPMSPGIYNLTRSGNSASMPSIVNSASMHMASPNGSSGMPSSSIHGLNIGGLPQAHQSMQVGQKVGLVPGTNSRPMTATAQGAQRPLQQHQQHGNLPMSHTMSAAGQIKPPVSASSVAMMPVSSLGTSATAGLSQPGSAAFQGSSSPAAGQSASMANTLPTFGVQPRQSPLTTAAVPQKSGAAATTTANSASSGVSTSSPASVMSPTGSTAANTIVTDQTTSS